MQRAFPTVILTALLGAGCLGSTYEVPTEDLRQLARTDPATRSQRVRVIQEFSTSREPATVAPAVGVRTGVYVGVGVTTGSGRRSSRPSGGSGGGAPGGGSGGGNVGGASSSAESSAVVVVLAAVAAVGLAATEGARYDGWASLHPLHPVHLQMPDGSWVWVPLQQLTPELADAADEAIVRRTEGPWTAIERAPLNRVGFTYGLELGSAALDSIAGTRPWGFVSKINFGGFPIQQLGILGGVGLGWGSNADNETIFNSRLTLELHAYPLTVGVLSLGAYGQGGIVFSEEDTAPFGETVSRDNPLYGGGGLIQLELTTRLALTARGGVSALVAPEGTHVLGEASIGLAIY